MKETYKGFVLYLNTVIQSVCCWTFKLCEKIQFFPLFVTVLKWFLFVDQSLIFLSFTPIASLLSMTDYIMQLLKSVLKILMEK